MNITVTVDDITLETVVRDGIAYGDEGEPYRTSRGSATIADLVAEQITERLASEDAWGGMKKRASEIRGEAIREAVRPQIEAALAAPLQKTNAYGEPVGEPTTLREIIVDEVRKMLKEPADSYNRDKGTRLAVLVRAEVEKAFASEVRDAVKQAREQVSAEIGQMVANAVQAGMKAR